MSKKVTTPLEKKYWATKYKELRSLPYLARVLWDGKTIWIGTNRAGEEIRIEETFDWGDRWAIYGPHMAMWWWVRKWGTLPCGCGVNPLYRRQDVWWSSRCTLEEHKQESKYPNGYPRRATLLRSARGAFSVLRALLRGQH